MTHWIRKLVYALGPVLLLLAAFVWIGTARYTQTLHTEHSHALNMREVGYHDLGRRAAFKMAMQQVGERWYLYLAHFWTPGWSVVDVTDPASPKHLRFIPGPANTATGNLQVANGLMITSLERPIYELVDHMPWEMYAWGAWKMFSGQPLVTPGIPFTEGLILWDLSEPGEPKVLSRWKTGHTGTHRNFYNGGAILWVAGHKAGFYGHQIIALDISDATSPREIGSWAFAEQHSDDLTTPSRSEAGYYFHGPIRISGNRGYASYGIKGGVIFDTTYPRRLKLLGAVNPFPESGSVQGAHTFLPLGNRGLAVLSTEAHEESCAPDPGRSYTALVDISTEADPRIISYFPDPVVPVEAPYHDFCARPGRSGVHNQHHSNDLPHLFNSDRFVFLAKFNEGVRLYDTINPHDVQEVAYFVPPDPRERLGPMPSALVAQTEDVLVDARGYVYITDKNQGLRVLEVTHPEFLRSLAE